MHTALDLTSQDVMFTKYSPIGPHQPANDQIYQLEANKDNVYAKQCGIYAL